MKRLTDLGHAIGGLAALGMAQLQALAATRADALPAPRPTVAGPQPTLGSPARKTSQQAMALQPVRVSGPFDSLAQAAAAVGRRR